MKIPDVQGEVFLLDRRDWTNGPPEVGRYTGHRVGERPSAIPCPYCQQWLRETVGEQRHRIVRILDRDAETVTALGQVIPETYRTLGCRPCRAQFTAPA